MRLMISPFDVLMFRDFRPFNAGESFIAKSIYPSPQAIVGAIRTKLLLKYNHSDEIRELIGYEKEEPGFEVYGVFFTKDRDEVFPLPRNIVKHKTDTEEFFKIKPMKVKWGNLTILAGKYMHYKGVGCFLDKQNLRKYLLGNFQPSEDNIIKEGDIVKREERVGIKLRDEKTTEEGFFYTCQFLRLEEDVGLSVWLDGRLKDYLENTGIIKLGGEGRGAYYQVFGNFEIDWEKDIIDRVNEDGRFLLYMATPTIVEQNGTCTWDIKIEIENKLGVTVNSLYAAIDKAQPVGGWDVAKKMPKLARYAIPQGSVYFIEFSGEVSRAWVKLGKLLKLGFGLGFVGVWGDEDV